MKGRDYSAAIKTMDKIKQSTEANKISSKSETLQTSFTFMQGLSRLMLMQGSPATTSMVHDAEEGFHTTLVSKEEGLSPITYDIIMLSLSGSLLLLVVISIAVKVLLRHCTSHHSSKDLSTPAVVLENTAVTNNISDKISTVDLTGPVCVSYISDRHTVSTEFANPEETISIFELPFFSFSVSVTPPDSPPEL